MGCALPAGLRQAPCKQAALGAGKNYWCSRHSRRAQLSLKLNHILNSKFTHVRTYNDHQQKMCVWDESDYGRSSKPDDWSTECFGGWRHGEYVKRSILHQKRRNSIRRVCG
ncbi:hypothetical protein ElyMa_000328300 [Elysia marginata]|uniref:Uncharacterized protein n=1 Tax=Elysia marginata TaxID=1093978 RepID=A0AAV4FB27_9GAST|nr:hypothetical protein ElyMa_000328300 [Elysia marginata]